MDDACGGRHGLVPVAKAALRAREPVLAEGRLPFLWARSRHPAASRRSVPLNRPAVIAMPDASRVQDIVVLARTLPLTRSDPDHFRSEHGSAVLGGSFYWTRLSVALRKRTGLV